MPAIGCRFSEGDDTYVPKLWDDIAEDDSAMDVDNKPVWQFSLDQIRTSDELEGTMSDSLRLEAGSEQSFVLLGHPGIGMYAHIIMSMRLYYSTGKSFLLYIVLILRLHWKLLTIFLEIFLENEQHVFVFSEIGVSYIDLTWPLECEDIKISLSLNAWVLVDVDATQFTRPTSATLELRRSTIIAVSYHNEHLTWEFKYSQTRRYFLDVWSEQEIIVGWECCLSTKTIRTYKG